MCEKCQQAKITVAQLLAAHLPTLATTPESAKLFRDALELAPTMIQSDTQEKDKAAADKLWLVYQAAPAAALEELHYVSFALRSTANLLIRTSETVIKDRIASGETAGFSIEVVEGAEAQIAQDFAMNPAIAEAVRALFADAGVRSS